METVDGENTLQAGYASTHPTAGWGWGGMLTILLVGLIAEGSEFLKQGFQWDAHGIVPALPDVEQQAVVPRRGQDVHEV